MARMDLPPPIYFDVDGVEVMVQVDGSEITVWAYKEKTSELMPNPAWVEVSQFDVRDYVGH